MMIDVLVCRTDGTLAIEQREVADNWFEDSEENAEARIDENAQEPEKTTE